MTKESKKITTITWEELVYEAMLALTGGKDTVEVPVDAMYHWIESTDYLTEKGRAPDQDWAQGRYPSYRASLQLRWQRMVQNKMLVRVETGVYRLPNSFAIPQDSLWEKMLVVNAETAQPVAKTTTTRRIQRSQKLRDMLVAFYESQCQVCGSDKTYSIPLLSPNHYYVEVHHVAGLAETYHMMQRNQETHLRVNGIENLVVLCPHHHAMMHHHHPMYKFDRKNLFWSNDHGYHINFQKIHPEHAFLLQSGNQE
jgi:hypothetical protein